MNFAGRRIAVLGAGREGRATLVYLLAHGADDVTVRDQTPSLKEALPEDVKVVLGDEYLDELPTYDVIFRSPGVRVLEPEVQTAKAAGVEISSHVKLFFAECPAPIVGVSGTKGKGTTSGLIAGMLEAAGKTVYLGGNIGTPPLEFLDVVRPDDVVVLELSSFQLQDLEQSPHVGVLTNLTEDHLDYHADVAEYHAAKSSLIAFQAADDVAVINADDLGSQAFENAYGKGIVKHFSHRQTADAMVKDGMVMLEGISVVPTADIPVPGPHNLDNVLAACLATAVFDVPKEAMAEAIRTYRGLPYHLEFIGEYGGVKYFNDSYATNPTATIPAIESFTEPIVLIVGGSEKKIDYGDLAEVILTSTVKALVVVGPAGASILQAVLNVATQTDRSAPAHTTIDTKEEIVPAAQAFAEPGDVILLSPAAQGRPARDGSFPMFPNYKERGRYFTQQVRGE